MKVIVDQRGRARRRRAEVERTATIGRILDAARSVLRERSVFDLSAAVVAIEAGVTRQNVHSYFPTMEELVYRLADQLTVNFQTAASELDVDDLGWPHLLAERIAEIILADPVPNRQVLLVSASQGRGIDSPTTRSSVKIISALERRNSVAADRASWLTLTLFRGVLFTWATEQFSADELRANLRDVADIVVLQRQIWSEESGGGGEQ